MSDNILPLHAVRPPTVAEDIKESLVALLERTLAEAKAGDITEICMLVQHADPLEWSDRSSMTQSIMTWVGRLETTKLDWIVEYKKEHEYE
jgi:hypothetical protein